ncbi:MAG: hypothetical protein IJ053_04095 [Lachnospiraceae bacterium]|nr:hypothetical protein [Lachnospiraceae bacterium]
MKVEMTERDKKLLVFLSIFVIVVCIGYWGIYPVVKDIGEINTKIQEEEDLKDLNEFKVSQLPLIEGETADMEEKIAEVKETYYDIMDSSEVDKYFTNMVLDFGLYSYDLSISMPNDTTDLEPYQYSRKALGMPDEEYYGEDTSSEDLLSLDDDEEDSEDLFEDEDNYSTTGIYTVGITMKLGGTETDLIEFIDYLSGIDKKLRVVNYSWSEERSIQYGSDSEDELGDFEIVTNKTLTISLEIYMCEE